VPLQTVCLRHVPPALAGDETALTRHNLELARRVNESGAAYLTPSLLKGRQMIRVSIGAEPTERRHVEALWTALEAAARA
jgi:aromatic-L-amino-acid decarboxylase